MKENKYWNKEPDIKKSSIVCRDEDLVSTVEGDDWETGIPESRDMNPVVKVWSFANYPLRRARPLNK